MTDRIETTTVTER